MKKVNVAIIVHGDGFCFAASHCGKYFYSFCKTKWFEFITPVNSFEHLFNFRRGKKYTGKFKINAAIIGNHS